jgi:dihydrofolate reductase
MLISIIVAMAENRIIGSGNQLPWRLPADLRHFRELTMGKPVIMGRKTFESIGKPLPGRSNIVISQDPAFQAQGCTRASTIAAALRAAGSVPEAMIIGGATLYAQCLPLAQRIYLTLVHESFSGDVSFPQFDAQQWRETARTDHQPDEKNPHAYSFITLERRMEAD